MKLRRSGSRDEPCQRASCSPVVSAALGSAPRPGVFTDGGGGAGVSFPERLGACRDTSAGTEHGAACRSLSLQRRGSLHRELAWRSSVRNVLVGPQRVVGLGGRCPREGAAGTEVCGGDAAWRARSASSAWPTEAGVWPGQWVGGGCGRNGEGAEGASSQGTPAKDRSQPPEAASGGWEDPGAGAVGPGGGAGADAPCAPADALSSPPPQEAEAGASPDSFQPRRRGLRRSATGVSVRCQCQDPRCVGPSALPPRAEPPTAASVAGLPAAGQSAALGHLLAPRVLSLVPSTARPPRAARRRLRGPRKLASERRRTPGRPGSS